MAIWTDQKSPVSAPAVQLSQVAAYPISAIVLTCNEAVNIRQCLQCMEAVDDIILVDSGSTDKTLEFARAVRSDVRIFQHPFKDFGEQRNWALDNTDPKYDWILFVDADEYCTPELLQEIDQFVQKPGDFVGGFIAGRNYFLGRWLKYSTMYPSYQLRLLKSGEVRYRKEGHGQKEVTAGALHYLQSGWRHEGFSKGVHQWIDRHNQYSSDETELILRLRESPLVWRDLVSSDPVERRRALKVLGAKLPFRAFNRFVYTYIFRRGFLDGYPGLLYCLLRVAHDIHITVKLKEKQKQKGSSPSANC